MSRNSWIAALLVLGTLACAGGDDTAADGAARTSEANGSGDVATDVASYELTMDRIDRMYDVQRNLAMAMKDMSPAEREAFDASVDPGESMDEMVRNLESNAVMKEALDDAGMSARDYVTGMFAMMQAGMAAAVIEMRPNDDADSLVREMNASMDNVEFMQQNRAELERKQQELEAELRAAGALDADDEE
jgi:hypothetical protein